MIVYLGLGTNLGNKAQNIERALLLLQKQVGNILRRSADFVSAPWGFSSENTFLNIVIAIDTELSPLALLHVIKGIELEMGRTQKSINGAYADRIIDIDILLYENEQINLPELIIPHPFINERDFVRIPLEEIKYMK